MGVAVDPENTDLFFVGQLNTPPLGSNEFTVEESVEATVVVDPPLSFSVPSMVTTSFTYTRITDARSYTYSGTETLQFKRFLPLTLQVSKLSSGSGDDLLITAAPRTAGGDRLQSPDVLVKAWLLSGSGKHAVGEILLRDDGQAPDTDLGNGVYSGAITPSCAVEGLQVVAVASKGGFLPDSYPASHGLVTRVVDQGLFCAAGISAPPPGSVLAGPQVTFAWVDGGLPVIEWWLYVGTSQGDSDLYNSGSVGQTLSTTVSGLPTDGRPLHVRLWYRTVGDWQFVDFPYTAFAAARGSPEVVSPSSGSVLPGPAVIFEWADNGAQVTDWWIYVGSSQGSHGLYDSGPLGTAMSRTVSGLPTDGSDIHVRLWYRVGSGWRSADFAYKVAGAPGVPEIISPSPGSVLPGSTVDFAWVDRGVPATEWWLYIGSGTGGRDLYNSGPLGTAKTVTATGLPVDSREVFVRL